MKTQPIVPISDVCRKEILAGRAAGHADLAKVERAVRSVASDGRVTLDFHGVEVVSSSYFDAAFWPLWSVVPEVYPVLLRLPAATRDDVELVLRSHEAAVWCRATERERVPALLGPLDATLKQTLGRIIELGETTAAELVSADGSIGVTGWSNRLAALHELRLVRRRKDGRQLVYLPAWKE